MRDRLQATSCQMATDCHDVSLPDLSWWWNDRATVTDVLASARIIWPKFVDRWDCIFFVPPSTATDKWLTHIATNGPSSWITLPLHLRRAQAAICGEITPDLLFTNYPSTEHEARATLLVQLTALLTTTWPIALKHQYPHRTIDVLSYNGDDGLTIRLHERTKGPGAGRQRVKASGATAEAANPVRAAGARRRPGVSPTTLMTASPAAPIRAAPATRSPSTPTAGRSMTAAPRPVTTASTAPTAAPPAPPPATAPAHSTAARRTAAPRRWPG